MPIDEEAVKHIDKGLRIYPSKRRRCAAVVYRFDNCRFHIDALGCNGIKHMLGAVCESENLI